MPSSHIYLQEHQELLGWLRAVSYPECYTRLGNFLTQPSTLITTGRGQSLIFQISPLRDDAQERRRTLNLESIMTFN